MTGVDFLDYLTKGAIIYGDRIGFGLGTKPIKTISVHNSIHVYTLFLFPNGMLMKRSSGLSNISFGLPERKFINQTFMVMAITKGLDDAIVNPLDKSMMGCITTAEMQMGSDS